MKKTRSGLLIAVKLLLMLSLCVLLYSLVQVILAPVEARQTLKDWEKKREEAPQPALPHEETPLPESMVTSPIRNHSSSASYTEGEIIGAIHFPTLNKRVAVLEGTGSPQLKKGAGHYKGSAGLGDNGNSVLAGHRDTVFRNLGELEIHDLIEIETTGGNYVYEVTGSIIVDGDERGAIQQSDDPVLTLITCYPFSYAGPAPERYLLSAKLIREGPLSSPLQ